MTKVLIDTHSYSLAMRGDDSVVRPLRKIDWIGFSAVSVGELFSGFKAGRYEEKTEHVYGHEHVHEKR